MTAQKGRSVLLTFARSAAKVAHSRVTSFSDRVKICRALLTGVEIEDYLSDFSHALSRLPVDERHYWIGTFYTLLLSAETRKAQATYFTPPTLAETVIDLATQAGFDIAADDVLDPAAGGAAFLSTLAGRAEDAGLDPLEASYRFNGIEIDRGLAALSRSLIADRLGAKPRRGMIVTADALRMKIPASYDLVIANPPYGRMSEDEARGLRWNDVCHRGHINKYALFVELCLRHAKPGGLIALVIPSSFRAGPLFAALRSHIRAHSQVLAIGTIAQRNRLFVDVAQDVSILTLRKGLPHDVEQPVAFHAIEKTTTTQCRATLPSDPQAPWALPSGQAELAAGRVLADWGIQARAGYFVWNRQRERLTTRANKGEAYPLIWAKNVRPGKNCKPGGKDGSGMDFVVFDKTSSAIISSPSAILQRTTNDKQSRRIVCAVVDPNVVKRWGGFTTENHTIVLAAEKQELIDLIALLLNTEEVDRRYRRVSGTASLSVTLLRQLDLPSPEDFRRGLSRYKGDAEKAARFAYSQRSMEIAS